MSCGGPLRRRYAEELVTSVFPMLQLTSSAAIRDHGTLGALAEHGVAATSDGGAVGALFFGGGWHFLRFLKEVDIRECMIIDFNRR